MHSNQCVGLAMRACAHTHTHTPGLKEEHILSPVIFHRPNLLVLKKRGGGCTAVILCVLQKEAGRISVQQTQTLERSKDLPECFLRLGSEER